jgi:hypothetical protein
MSIVYTLSTIGGLILILLGYMSIQIGASKLTPEMQAVLVSMYKDQKLEVSAIEERVKKIQTIYKVIGWLFIASGVSILFTL